MILRRCAWGSRDPGKRSCRTRSIRSSVHPCCLQVRLESWEVSSCLEPHSYGARLVVPSWDRCRRDSTLRTLVQISTSLWSSLLNTGSGWSNMVHHDRSCQPKLRKADAVIFTDGRFPDGSEGSPLKPWIGGVFFKIGCQPLQFGCEVPQSLIDHWLPRKSQIAMVEMFATLVALETFREQISDSSPLLFVDSESVQGALVKGYSAREDLCELVGSFLEIKLLTWKVNLYIDRISTDANPADPPSRDRMDVGVKLGWRTVESKFPIWQRGWRSFVWTVQGSCGVLLLLLWVFGSMNRSSNTFWQGCMVPFFFDRSWKQILTRSNWPPAHPRSQGNKRACSCVAAKITLLPNNCNWFTNLRSGMVGIRGSIFSVVMSTLCSFGFKSLSCHFGEIYWIELPRTKSSHPTHPVNWIDGVEIICVNCSRFLWRSVVASLGFGSMNKATTERHKNLEQFTQMISTHAVK